MTDDGRGIDLISTQRYCWVMIPASIDAGAPWRVLPPGIHEASLDEVESVFGSDAHRRHLCDGLRRGCQALHLAGCQCVYLDGSYVTEKPKPNDFDACWDPTGVDLTRLDPVLMDFSHGRRNQKAKYAGEFFPSVALADGTRTLLEFFQVEKITGLEKGVIRIRL